MATLDTVYVIHTTSQRDGSATDASFSLLVPATGKVDPLAGHFERTFPKQPHDNRERGRTDAYEFDVRGMGVDHKEARGRFQIEIKGSDAWRPSSIWILGRLHNGRFRILGASPNWPSDRLFSTDAAEGRRAHEIPVET